MNHEAPRRLQRSPLAAARALAITTAAACALAITTAGPAAAAEGSARSIARDLAFPAPRVAASEDGRWSVVSLVGGELAGPVGAPEIPSVRVRLSLGTGERVQAATLEVVDQETIRLDRPPRPYAGGRSTAQEHPPAAEPDAAVYASDALYPPSAASPIASIELSGGARFGVVRVHPLRVRPATGELVVVRQARLRVTIAGGQSAAPPDGSGRVQYVILTGDDPELVAAWQRLADWKTSTGDPALVLTTDWVRDHYAGGADLAETIRLFLRDAHQTWGLQAVLLGGDVDLIPTRMVGIAPNDVSSDIYYACLDGTWDANGNGIFGERPRDNPDLVPNIYVGRVSVRTADQVEAFLAKYFTYVQAPPEDGYLDRGLMLGEVLFHADWSRNGRGPGIPDCDDCAGGDSCRESEGQAVCVAWDGAEDCFAIESALLQAGYPGTLDFLLERAEYWAEHEPIHQAQVESRASTLNHLSQGYNVVLHVGHGSWDRWAVGDGRLEVTDLPLLANGAAGRYFIAYGVNCSSASITLDGFGEQLILLPDQGALAYVGSTYASSAGWAAVLARDFFTYLYTEEGGTLGDGFYGSLAANADVADMIVFGRALLGDPTMRVWRRTPGHLAIDIPATVAVGSDSLLVTIRDAGSRSAVAGARVCLQKSGEAYAVGLTGPDGGVRLPFLPRSAGEFQVTATTPAHRPATATGSVSGALPAAALRVVALSVGDGEPLGNGNGRIERGETVRLSLEVENLGMIASAPVTGRLRVLAAPAGLLAVTDSTATLAAIAGGATGSDAEAFALTVDPAAGDAQFGSADRVAVELAVELWQGESRATCASSIAIERPRLEVDVNRWEAISADSARVWVGVLNAGEATASRLRCTLAPAAGDSGIIAVTPGALVLEDLPPGSALRAGPFTLVHDPDRTGRLRFAVADTLHPAAPELHVRAIATSAPAAPAEPMATGLREAVELSWTEPAAGPTPMGYVVLRAAEGETTLTPAHPRVLRDHRYFLDDLLADLRRYRYAVCAVDSGGNAGAPSETVLVSTCPGLAAGWPQQFVYSAQTAAPLICEIDGVPDPQGCAHAREIFFGGDLLQAYHGQGTELADGDGDVITSGPFSLDLPPEAAKYEFRGKAAAGDLEGDGDVEVLAVSREYKQLLCWGPEGGQPRWARRISASIAWRTPVLADLDGDGDLEVIVTGGEPEHEGICVFDHQGEPHVPGTNGQIADLGDKYLYHSPAVGDVNGDGALEIVIPTRSGKLCAIAGTTGESLAGFEGLAFSRWEPGQGSRASPALAEVDGRAGDEIFVVTTGFLWSFTGGGELRWHEPFELEYGTSSSADLYPEPALGDIDGDGQIDIAVVEAAGRLWARRAFDGALLESFPVELERGTSVRYGSCILANVDADPLPEILFGDSEGRIYGYTAAGLPARGFPIEFGGSFSKLSLAAWDVDGDGFQNLVAQAEGVQKLGVYHLAEAPFDPGQNPWPMRHRDAYNSGRYAVPARAIAITQWTAQASPQGVVQVDWSSTTPPAAFEVRRWGPRTGSLPGELHRLGRVAGGEAEAYAVADTLPAHGIYRYCIQPIGSDGLEQPGASAEVEWTGVPESPFAFDWAGPSPGLTGKRQRVVFHLPTDAGVRIPVELRLFDVQGRLVRTLLDESIATGPVAFEWQGCDENDRRLPAGLYILRLAAAGEEATRRILLLQ